MDVRFITKTTYGCYRVSIIILQNNIKCQNRNKIYVRIIKIGSILFIIQTLHLAILLML